MNWTRRKFLSASAAVPLIAIETRAAPSNTFNTQDESLLRAAMDEIIPASDGMPAASQVGGLQYLERVAGEDSTVANEIRNSLAALNKCSEQLFDKAFDQLNRDNRISALRKLETSAPVELAKLRDYIYESYYTQPAVWKLIGYEFYPTDHPGPHMKPFDDSILAEVRKRPRLYREA